MSLKTFVAGLGDNAEFVATNAHWGFAFFLMTVAYHFGAETWEISLPLVLLFGLKEFWFDKHFETAPPQDFLDNLEDFGGYLFGIVLGIILHAVH
jgi:hypothetical protein